jgi:hypothetical protein
MKNEYLEFQNRISSLYVEHQEVKRIWGLLDSRRKQRSRNMKVKNAETPRNLFILGQSRVGKSLMMKKYAERAKPFTKILDDGTEIDIRPVAYMDLPSPFTYGGLYNQIIEMGLKAPRSSSSAKVGEIKSRAYNLMRIQEVEMLIIDELDYLLTTSFVDQKVAMELIKNICNEAGVVVVCVGTPEIEILRTLKDQFVGRFPPTTIRSFNEFDETFIYLLQEIENQLRSPVPLGLANTETVMPEFLHKLCGGLVGWLKPILEEVFDIVGVMDDEFNDFSVLNSIDGKVLLKARENVIGDLTEEQIYNFINGISTGDKKKK